MISELPDQDVGIDTEDQIRGSVFLVCDGECSIGIGQRPFSKVTQVVCAWDVHVDEPILGFWRVSGYGEGGEEEEQREDDEVSHVTYYICYNGLSRGDRNEGYSWQCGSRRD